MSEKCYFYVKAPLRNDQSKAFSVTIVTDYETVD